MKKILNSTIILGAVILLGSGCKKFLDINTNPNSPTDATPELVLPQAIVTSASSTVSYDNFGAWTGGYKANAGGYGGWGTVWTYNFTSSDYTALWTSAFDGINQLNVVLSKTDSDGPYKYHNAMARIMKAYLYTRLIDQYGDVPYSEANQGLNNLSPKYDNYADVYKALYADLNAAIAILNTAPETNVTKAVTAGQDPYGGGSAAAGLTKWKQWANTIKLKMLVRAQKVSDLASWVTTAKATLPTAATDYIVTDAIVQPGHSATTASQVNPKWAAYTWNTSGTAIGSGLSQLPTLWILDFYKGGKLKDDVRGKAVYASYNVNVNQTISGIQISFSGPATNQLGYDTDPIKRSQNGSYWYSGVGRSSRPTGTTANGATDVGGVLKGGTMGTVLMTLSEAKFLLAEASLESVNLLPALSGSTKTLFEDGITASFQYLYSNAAGTYFNATSATTLKDTYKTDNAGSRLVDLDLATTDEQKLEAIITQKYIAVNFINSEEGFNEYRRTGYPKQINGSIAATESFASLKSGAPAADKLPTRVLYPAVEFQVNADNVPKGISSYTTKIFYAK